MILDGIYMDVETDGLYGRAWVICARKYQNGEMVSEFVLRDDLPISTEWVATTVLPHNLDIPIVEDLYEEFAKWWLENREDGVVFAHMGSPVESGVFRELYARGLMKWEEGPFPLHDVASMLLMRGENPLSVDEYLTKYGIRPEGKAQDCRYDVNATVAAVNHLI